MIDSSLPCSRQTYKFRIQLICNSLYFSLLNNKSTKYHLVKFEYLCASINQLYVISFLSFVYYLVIYSLKSHNQLIDDSSWTTTIFTESSILLLYTIIAYSYHYPLYYFYSLTIIAFKEPSINNRCLILVLYLA